MVGTMKGLWLYRSNDKRNDFEVSGPHLAGKAIYSVAYDPSSNRLLAGASSMHWGALVHHSDDLGKTWVAPEEANVKFPEGSDWSLKQVWQLHPTGDGKTVYAGVEPASLFRSTDAGESFELVKGLYDHPHRPTWQPGGGGLCLHTIVIDPEDDQRIYVAISTGGVYRSTDGGESWAPANNGVRAEFLPEKYPEYGQCVHKIAMNPSEPRRFYLQNHWGLYRSDDGADTWYDIANGVPSDFGFPMVVHPHDPDTAYVIPLESDMFRSTPEAKCRVYKTTDGGKSWGALTKGLPQKNAYVTVLRDSFVADALQPAGLYFGTRDGVVFASSDEGDSWRQIAQHLPPVVAVKAATLSDDQL
jgi:photosystem II stability/assembly factor-like uncharacterized protein